MLNFYHLTLEILKHFCLINTCNYCVHTSGYGTVVCTMFMDSRAETTPLVICVTRLQKKSLEANHLSESVNSRADGAAVEAVKLTG